MAKTKYIVPAVAMMLCVVSLIGAAYAAYSATLTDTESVTATSKYFDLKLGTGTDFNNAVDLKWDTGIAYSGGEPGATTWTLQTTPVIDLGKFMVDINSNNTGETSPTTYNLNKSALSVTGGPSGIDAKLTLAVYTDSTESPGSPGSEVVDTSALAIGTMYHMVLVPAAFSTTTAPTTITLAYTLTATANIA